MGQYDDAPPGIPGVLIPEDVAATLGRTGVMPAVVLNRDLFLLVGGSCTTCLIPRFPPVDLLTCAHVPRSLKVRRG